MAVFTGYIKPASIFYKTAFTVILPQKKHIRSASSPDLELGSFEKDYPLLLLLPDEAESGDEYRGMTLLERYASEAGIAVVIPDCNLSYYVNMETRDKPMAEKNDTHIAILQTLREAEYESYLITELLPYVRRMFPVTARREKTFILGKGMGGYGALRLALKNPELFSSACSVAGFLDITWMMKMLPERKEQMQAVFGTSDADALDEDYSVFAHMRKAADAGKMPEVVQMYSSEHWTSEMNESFAREFASVPGVSVYPSRSDSNWDYFDEAIKQYMKGRR